LESLFLSFFQHKIVNNNKFQNLSFFFLFAKTLTSKSFTSESGEKINSKKKQKKKSKKKSIFFGEVVFTIYNRICFSAFKKVEKPKYSCHLPIEIAYSSILSG